MNPIGAIEKLINEHGSAVILKQQLEFAKDQFSAMERSVSEIQIKLAKVEALLDIQKESCEAAKKELQQIKDEHSEEIRIYNLVEFRRGKRTGGQWMAFCAKCHLPASEDYFSREVWAFCSAQCGWRVKTRQSLQSLASGVH